MQRAFLCSAVLCLLASLPASAASAASADSADAVFYPIPQQYDEEVLVLAIQGLVNRHGAQLLLNSSFFFWQYRNADAYWRSYFENAKGITFEDTTSLDALVARFHDTFTGLAIYDASTDADATRYLALMHAANQSLLPVTPALVAAHQGLQAMSVVVDLRGRFPNTAVGEAAAWQYALQYQRPWCTDKTFVYSTGRSHGAIDMGGDLGVQIGLDYPVMQNAFIINLSPDASRYPSDAALFDAALSSGPSAVFGWAEPEPLFTARVTKNGAFVMCDAAPNLSFWAKVAAAPPRLPAPGPVSSSAPYKVVFQTNEGDTPKIVTGLMSGQWLSPARGSQPIAWGINPGIAERFPAIIEYYSNTATNKDSFFAGCSGAGYAYPHLYNPSALQAYFAHVQHAVRTAMSQPAVVDVWDDTLNMTLMQQYASAVPEIACFTFQPKGGATNLCLPSGVPLLQADDALFYPNLNATDRVGDLLSRIVRVASLHPPPFTILVYGLLTNGDDSLPQVASIVPEIAARLPADQFEIVTITTACALARERCAHAPADEAAGGNDA